MRRVILWIAGIGTLMFTVTQPQDAAQVVKSLWGGLMKIGNGLGDFITYLTS